MYSSLRLRQGFFTGFVARMKKGRMSKQGMFGEIEYGGCNHLQRETEKLDILNCGGLDEVFCIKQDGWTSGGGGRAEWYMSLEEGVEKITKEWSRKMPKQQ